MTLNQRNRIVVFRLTQDEYDSLKTACVAAGRRNISDYTRSGLLELAHTHSVTETLERRFYEIESKLDDLQNLLKKLVSENQQTETTGSTSS